MNSAENLPVGTASIRRLATRASISWLAAASHRDSVTLPTALCRPSEPPRPVRPSRCTWLAESRPSQWAAKLPNAPVPPRIRVLLPPTGYKVHVSFPAHLLRQAHAEEKQYLAVLQAGVKVAYLAFHYHNIPLCRSRRSEVGMESCLWQERECSCCSVIGRHWEAGLAGAVCRLPGSFQRRPRLTQVVLRRVWLQRNSW